MLSNSRYNAPAHVARQNCLFPLNDLDQHLIHGSLNPHESALQTACRSVQPFFAQLTRVLRATSVAVGRI